jgi:putative ubiquitin-RnfH superfamily antitoxin RatB of RatAB toxin-antitoxin module
VELALPAGATLGDALNLARRDHECLPEALRMAIDWQGAAVGIWGEISSRSAALRNGDRIEIYRPLSLDPKQGRRQRAQSRRS